MKAYYLLSALMVTASITSCTIENRLDRKADKLIGVWEIDKVIYDRYGGWFRKKVTEDYRHDIFEFLPDHTVYYYDDDIDFEFAGNWDVVAERNYDYDDDEEIEFYIEMHFYDPVLHEAFGYHGYISRLSSQKFHFHVSDGSGELEFRFQRK